MTGSKTQEDIGTDSLTNQLYNKKVQTALKKDQETLQWAAKKEMERRYGEKMEEVTEEEMDILGNNNTVNINPPDKKIEKAGGLVKLLIGVGLIASGAGAYAGGSMIASAIGDYAGRTTEDTDTDNVIQLQLEREPEKKQ